MITLVLVLLGLLVLARPIYAVVRFVMLPAAAKRNYPAALWARWRWRWLSRNLGLAYLDTHRKAVKPVPFGTSVKVAPNTVATGKLRFPRASIRADAFGLVARVKTVPGTGRAEFEKAAPYVADSWRCHRVQISQPKPGRLVVRGLRTDPLTLPFGIGDAPAPAGPDQLYLGRDEWGIDRWAQLPRLGGITVGGLTGYGKTSLMNSWLMHLAGLDCVQLVIIDGKGAADYSDWAHRAWIYTADDLGDAVAALEDVHALMRSRFAAGCRNLWRTGPTKDQPLVVTVVDECHTFLDLDAVKGQQQAEKQVRACRALGGQLVRKGRAALLLSVFLTQKQTGDSIPTAIRDNCGLGLSFAARTKEAAVAALGEQIREYPSYCPTTLQDPAYVGVATASLRTGTDPFVRLRVPYVTESAAMARAAETAASCWQPVPAAAGQPALTAVP